MWSADRQCILPVLTCRCLYPCLLISSSVCMCLWQQSMVVPSTPLHTTRVLTEDREMWEDVKVRSKAAPTLSGHSFTFRLVTVTPPVVYIFIYLPTTFPKMQLKRICHLTLQIPLSFKVPSLCLLSVEVFKSCSPKWNTQGHFLSLYKTPLVPHEKKIFVLTKKHLKKTSA